MRKKLTGIIALTRPAQALLFIAITCLAANLLGIGPSATAQDQTGEVTFATPEEAITFYMQAVTQNDISQIMQACAINEIAENFNFDFFTERTGYLIPTALAPSDYSFYAEMNKTQLSWQILNQVKNLAYGLLATEKSITEGLMVPVDAASAAQFMAEVDPARLARLQVIEIAVPHPETVNTERNQNNWDKAAQVYGADEHTERVVLLLFEGNYYYIGFTVLRYGENWKISNAYASLGELPTSGTPQEITEEAFRELVTGN